MNKHPANYRHIIWDWNGTLLDDLSLSIETINSLLSRRNMRELDLHTYKAVFGFPVSRYYKKLGFDFDREPFNVIANEYIEYYNNRWKNCSLHEGVDVVLGSFLSEGISQSVLSASKQDTLESMIKHYGIENYFIGLNGIDDHYAEGKTDRGKRWIRELGVDPAEVLLIGDTVHDFEVSRVIGCGCILVSCGHHAHDTLLGCGVDVVDSVLACRSLLINRTI